MTQRYIIVNDDSGDDYYIPAEKSDHWEGWVGSEAWEMGDVPEYAGYIDGTFTFTDPQTN